MPMAARTTPPFRADHVGSLLRPPELLRAREDHAAGRITADELRAVEDDAIAAAVRMQEDIGLLSATDGEFRRAAWHMDFIYALGGVGRSDKRLALRFYNEKGMREFTTPAIRIDGPIRLERTIFGADFEFLKSQTTTATPKLTIPAPSMVHYRMGRGALNPDVYPEVDEFWRDLSATYADEIRRLDALGCTYLQLDDTSMAMLNDPRRRAILEAQGGDPEHQHERYVEAINAALADRPAGMTVAFHMCRGNHRSAWAAEGGYDFVAEAVFSRLDVDAFFLEYDDERSGGFEPLRFVPRGKRVVLGLVTSKRGALENKDDLKRRIDEAAKYLPLDQLCLSPQCGFASTVEGNLLTHDEQVAKLRLVVETAHEVWD
jgi:5-methyltetrahydropteroyltriglutamate--homocysteine methyltransferase